MTADLRRVLLSALPPLLVALSLLALAPGFRAVAAGWHAADGRGDDRFLQQIVLGGGVPAACGVDPSSSACTAAIRQQWQRRLQSVTTAEAQPALAGWRSWLGGSFREAGDSLVLPAVPHWLDADAAARLARYVDNALAGFEVASGTSPAGISKRRESLNSHARNAVTAGQMEAFLLPDPAFGLPSLFWRFAILTVTALLAGSLIAHLARPAPWPMAMAGLLWASVWACLSLADPAVGLDDFLPAMLPVPAAVALAGALGALGGVALGAVAQARRWGFAGGLTAASPRWRDVLVMPLIVTLLGASLLALLDLATGFRDKALTLPVEQYQTLVFAFAVATLMPILRFVIAAALQWPLRSNITYWCAALPLLAASGLLAIIGLDAEKEAHLWAEWVKLVAVLLMTLHLSLLSRPESRWLDAHDWRLIAWFIVLLTLSFARSDFAPVLILSFLTAPVLIARMAGKDLALVPGRRRMALWVVGMLITLLSGLVVARRAGTAAALLTVLVPATLVMLLAVFRRFQRRAYQPAVLDNGDAVSSLLLLGLFHLLLHALVTAYLALPSAFAEVPHVLARIDQMLVPVASANSDLWRIGQFTSGAGAFGYGPSHVPWCGHESLVQGSDFQAAARACRSALPKELSTDYGWTMAVGQFGSVGAYLLFAATAALLALLATRIRVLEGEADLIRRDVLAERVIASLVLVACLISALQLVLTVLGNLRLIMLTGVYWPFYSFSRTALLLLGAVLGLSLWRSRGAVA